MKTKILSILFMVSLLLTGCNYREINNMPMVTGLGVDIKEDFYLVTMALIVPDSSGVQDSTTNIILEADGETVFDAIRDLIMKGGEKVYFGHLQYIILGYELAKEDVTKALDLTLRDDELREDIWLLIASKDTTANDILSKGIKTENFRYYIPTALQNVSSVSKYNPILLCEFLNMELNKGITPTIPMISLEESLGEERLLINGGYIIKDKKVNQFLLGKDIQLYRLITGREKGGIHVLYFEKDSQTTRISFEVVQTNVKTSISKKVNGEFHVDLDITISGIIAEVMNSDVDIIEPEYIDEIKKQATEEMTDEVSTFISNIQKKASVDIFGFGEKIKKKYPKDYKEVEENWDNIFSTLDIHPTVKFEIRNTALCKQLL